MTTSRKMLLPTLILACCALPAQRNLHQPKPQYEEDIVTAGKPKYEVDATAAAKPKYEIDAVAPTFDAVKTYEVDEISADQDPAPTQGDSDAMASGKRDYTAATLQPTKVIKVPEQEPVNPRDPDPVTLPQVGPGLLASPELTMKYYTDRLIVQVSAPMEYMGLVLLAPTPDLAHFFTGLPPMLAQGVPTAIAKSSGGILEFQFPYKGEPLGVWGQALILVDDVIMSSEIASAGPVELDR